MSFQPDPRPSALSGLSPHLQPELAVIVIRDFKKGTIAKRRDMDVWICKVCVEQAGEGGE